MGLEGVEKISDLGFVKNLQDLEGLLVGCELWK